MFDTDLAKPNTVADMVEQYIKAKGKIREAYRLLDEARDELNTAFSEKTSGYIGGFDTLPRDNRYDIPRALEEVEKSIKQSVWRRMVNKMDIRKLLSIKRAEDLEKRLSKPEELPEISLPAIYDMFETLTSNANNFIDELIAEVYNYLRPWERSKAAQYKTNQKNAKFEIGKKVILTWTLENKWGGGFRVKYGQIEQSLLSIDRVFHALDGKSMLNDGYKSPLIDAINTCTFNGIGETEYFKFRCYSNQNLHLEFKRLDLLQELNRVAGGMNLKPKN